MQISNESSDKLKISLKIDENHDFETGIDSF